MSVNEETKCCCICKINKRNIQKEHPYNLLCDDCLKYDLPMISNDNYYDGDNMNITSGHKLIQNKGTMEDAMDCITLVKHFEKNDSGVSSEIIIVNTKEKLKEQLCLVDSPEKLKEFLDNFITIKNGMWFFDVDRKTINLPMSLQGFWCDSFCSWTLPPCYGTLLKIQQFIKEDTVLELGSGGGLWAKILQILNVKIIPTDVCEYKSDNYGCDDGGFSYTDVESLEHEQALIKYGKISDVLMVIWGRGFPTSACRGGEQSSYF